VGRRRRCLMSAMRLYIMYYWTVPNLLPARQARSGSSAALFDERDITPGIFSTGQYLIYYYTVPNLPLRQMLWFTTSSLQTSTAARCGGGGRGAVTKRGVLKTRVTLVHPHTHTPLPCRYSDQVNPKKKKIHIKKIHAHTHPSALSVLRPGKS